MIGSKNVSFNHRSERLIVAELVEVLKLFQKILILSKTACQISQAKYFYNVKIL